jgi:hypothetical protein
MSNRFATLHAENAARRADPTVAAADTAAAIDQVVRGADDDLVSDWASDPVPATTPWESLTRSERRALRARNELARRARVAALAERRADDRERGKRNAQKLVESIDPYDADPLVVKRKLRQGGYERF